MIFFGTRGVNKTQSEGEFHCPGCARTNPYRHKSVRRFFTLYFIPLIPLDHLGEFIECQSCKATYHLQVLDQQPEAQAEAIEAHFQSGARKVMISMLLADGVIDDGEVTVIQNIYQDIAGRPLAEADLRTEIARIQASGETLADLLSEMRGYLNPEGAEMIVRAGFQVAMADGEYHESEHTLLWQIAQGLGITPAHFKGLLSELVEGTSPSSGPPALPN
jgi:uncharacterized tellurite resistance protein B-like protein